MAAKEHSKFLRKLFTAVGLNILLLSPTLTTTHAESSFDTLLSENSASDSEGHNANEDISGDRSESVDEATETNLMTIDFRDYIPFAQFLRYHYVGDETTYPTQDVIMEYTPDGAQIFQVSAFSPHTTTAYIYQIRDNGLYQLAYFNDYYLVEDLRYSADASDGVESLILPAQMRLGDTFNSGYHQEINRTVVALHDTFTVGNLSFNNVLQIQEQRPTEGSHLYYDYYYAPMYGLVAINATDTQGNVTAVFQMTSTESYIQ